MAQTASAFDVVYLTVLLANGKMAAGCKRAAMRTSALVREFCFFGDPKKRGLAL